MCARYTPPLAQFFVYSFDNESIVFSHKANKRFRIDRMCNTFMYFSAKDKMRINFASAHLYFNVHFMYASGRHVGVCPLRITRPMRVCIRNVIITTPSFFYFSAPLLLNIASERMLIRITRPMRAPTTPRRCRCSHACLAAPRSRLTPVSYSIIYTGSSLRIRGHARVK